MFNRLKWVINLGLGIIFLLMSQVSFAAPFSVTNNNASGAGSLLQAINDLNSSGTSGSSAGTNTITINAGLGTINLTSDLPVIQKGVTITTASGTQTISGASAYRLFATFQSSLSLTNLNTSFAVSPTNKSRHPGQACSAGAVAGIH